MPLLLMVSSPLGAISTVVWALLMSASGGQEWLAE
jgi:hypothetical protein